MTFDKHETDGNAEAARMLQLLAHDKMFQILQCMIPYSKYPKVKSIGDNLWPNRTNLRDVWGGGLGGGPIGKGKIRRKGGVFATSCNLVQKLIVSAKADCKCKS